MNTSLQNIIKQIVSEQGESILADSRRLKAFVSDLACDEPKEDRIAFGRAIEQGFYMELKNAAPSDRSRIKAALLPRLQTITGYDTSRCNAAIDILETVMFGQVQQKTKICQKCGKELQEEWKTCPYCSAVVEKKSVEEKSCQKCGKKMQADWKSCPHCSAVVANENKENANRIIEPASPEKTTPISDSELKESTWEMVENELGFETLLCCFGGVIIKVEHRLTGVKLFVNNKLMDHWKGFFKPLNKTKILQAKNYPFKSGPKTIEVYYKTGMFISIQVCINGVYIGGKEM